MKKSSILNSKKNIKNSNNVVANSILTFKTLSKIFVFGSVLVSSRLHRNGKHSRTSSSISKIGLLERSRRSRLWRRSRKMYVLGLNAYDSCGFGLWIA